MKLKVFNQLTGKEIIGKELKVLNRSLILFIVLSTISTILFSKICSLDLFSLILAGVLFCSIYHFLKMAKIQGHLEFYGGPSWK